MDKTSLRSQKQRIPWLKSPATKCFYHVLVYGGPDGYQTNRSQIALYGPTGGPVAFLRFNDPGMTFEADSRSGDTIFIYLTSAMFQSVLDLLRNEKLMLIGWAQNRGFFGTASTEAVGEGEA